MVYYAPTNIDKNAVSLNDVVGQELDFSKLSDTMDKLSTSSEELSDMEKQAAIEVIGQWENNVIDSIEQKQRDIQGIVHSLDMRYNNFDMEIINMPEFQGLIKATDSEDILKEYMMLEDALARHEIQKPSKPANAVTDTVEERINASHAYSAESEKWHIKVAQLHTAMNEAMFKLKCKLNESEAVKKILAQANTYNRNVKKKILDAKMVSQQAKINVSINSAEAKEALRELLEFQKGI